MTTPEFDPTHPQIIMAQNLAAAAISAETGQPFDHVLCSVIVPAGRNLHPLWTSLADVVKLAMAATVKAKET